MKSPDLETWNFRMVCEMESGLYCVAEVYYDKKDNAVGWCAADLEHYESPKELLITMSQMKRDVEGQSCLEYDNDTEKFKERK